MKTSKRRWVNSAYLPISPSFFLDRFPPRPAKTTPSVIFTLLNARLFHSIFPTPDDLQGGRVSLALVHHLFVVFTRPLGLEHNPKCESNVHGLSRPAVFSTAFIDFRRPLEKDGFLLYWRLLDCLLILWCLVRIYYYYSILGGLNWRNNHCTKYFHYLLRFPFSWIIYIDSASVSSTHIQHTYIGQSNKTPDIAWKCLNTILTSQFR